MISLENPKEASLINPKGEYLNLQATFDHAAGLLAARNPRQAAAAAGVPYRDNCFYVNFLKHNYRVVYPGGLARREDGARASLYHNIILLHYLATANGQPLSGQWVAFRHLPGGDIYSEPFQRRAIIPFLKAFGDRPDGFIAAATFLDGYRLNLSGISMVVPVLPRVSLLFTLWPGDEEFAANANILFDAGAAGYLPTEDYAHLPALVVKAMQAVTAAP